MEILRALLVGVIAAVPFGPILVMVVQRTLCHGRKTGLMVGGEYPSARRPIQRYN